MNMHVVPYRRLLAFAGIALVSLVGCNLSGGIELGGLDGELGEQVVISLEADFTEPPLGDGETEARGLVVAPDEVTIYVGDELFVELTLTDPSVTRIVPGQLPLTAEFAEDEFGAVVHWMPALADVGQHDFIFLIVDANEDNLILGTTSIVVSVLPRFGLIEYGF